MLIPWVILGLKHRSKLRFNNHLRTTNRARLLSIPLCMRPDIQDVGSSHDALLIDRSGQESENSGVGFGH